MSSVFSSSAPEVAPFPVEVLPGALRRFVTESAGALSCPPEYIGVPSLAVLGTAIGTGRTVEVKVGWVEYPLLFAAVIGEPGSAKSPALSLATEPIQLLQKQYSDDHLAAKLMYDQSSEGEEGGTTRSKRGQGQAPHMSQIVTTDTTIESLATVLSRNPHGVILIRDELTAWVRSMNEYREGRGADRQHWQSIWNLAPVTINRKNLPEPLVIPRPFAAVTGCLPPEMLRDLSDERGRNDGFLHRILFAYPEWRPMHWTDAAVDTDTRRRYHKLFDDLRGLPICLIPGVGHMVVRFTDKGGKRFAEWAKTHYAELGEGPPHLRGPWSKLVAYGARLALIIHLSRYVSKEVGDENIDEESISSAIALIDFFKSHAKKVYGELRADPAERRLRAAVEWIRKRPGQQASTWEIITAGVAGCNTKASALHLLDCLQKFQWGRIHTSRPASGGRPRFIFKLDTADR